MCIRDRPCAPAETAPLFGAVLGAANQNKATPLAERQPRPILSLANEAPSAPDVRVLAPTWTTLAAAGAHRRKGGDSLIRLNRMNRAR
eukprot:2138549-Pyramimonas_sp.AAC.1